MLRRPERDPLYWSDAIANAAVFLLVRDDLPLPERQERVRERARLLPQFVSQCRENFTRAKRNEVAPEFCKTAVGQLRATATFYRGGFAPAVGDNPESRGEGGRPPTTPLCSGVSLTAWRNTVTQMSRLIRLAGGRM